MSDLFTLYGLLSVCIYLPINSDIMEPQLLHQYISPYAKNKKFLPDAV
jgi:hypothetical protein